SKLTCGGVQPSSACSQPQNRATPTSRPTQSSCHQKPGTANAPGTVQGSGCSRDQARAATSTRRTTGSQAPRANSGQVFFQSPANSQKAHQATRASSGASQGGSPYKGHLGTRSGASPQR